MCLYIFGSVIPTCSIFLLYYSVILNRYNSRNTCKLTDSRKITIILLGLDRFDHKNLIFIIIVQSSLNKEHLQENFGRIFLKAKVGIQKDETYGDDYKPVIIPNDKLKPNHL